MTIHHEADTTQAAWLAAQIAADQPSLPAALRSASTRVCQYAGMLEAALGNYRPLEGYLEDAVRHVEVRTGRKVSEELFACLLDRFGVTDARLALERVAEGGPDEAEDSASGE
jgi:hypothetical protein